MMLTYYHLFRNVYMTKVGAGDLATGPYAPILSPAYHTLLTNMYNDMVNSSLPLSVLEFPKFTALP